MVRMETHPGWTGPTTAAHSHWNIPLILTSTTVVWDMTLDIGITVIRVASIKMDPKRELIATSSTIFRICAKKWRLHGTTCTVIRTALTVPDCTMQAWSTSDILSLTSRGFDLLVNVVEEKEIWISILNYSLIYTWAGLNISIVYDHLIFKEKTGFLHRLFIR